MNTNTIERIASDAAARIASWFGGDRVPASVREVIQVEVAMAMVRHAIEISEEQVRHADGVLAKMREGVKAQSDALREAEASVAAARAMATLAFSSPSGNA